MIDELENIYNRKVNSTIRALCTGTNGTIKVFGSYFLKEPFIYCAGIRLLKHSLPASS